MTTAYTNNGGMGDRTAFITVTSDMFVSGDPNDLVDGVKTPPGLAMDAGKTGGHITFDFGVGADPIIDEFRYYIKTTVNSLTAGSWYFQGSNDGSSWTNLSTTPGSSWLMTAGDFFAVAMVTVSGFQDTTGYRYFRMAQNVSTIPPSEPQLIEVEFKINSSESVPDPDPPPPPTPDYGEPGGTGNRLALIWVSERMLEAQFSTKGNARNLVNGNTSTDDEYNAVFMPNEGGSGSKPASFIFDFGPTGYFQRITEIKLYWAATEANVGLWAFEGSNRAQSGWVTLASGLALAQATTETFSFTNPDGYRFYRLRKTNTTAFDGTEVLREIEFKIGKTDVNPEPLPYYITGDRTGDITVTMVDSGNNPVFWFGGSPSNDPNDFLFNGNFTDANSALWGSTDKMTFVFPLPIAINEMAVYFNTTNFQAGWTVEGSNDGSSWDLLNEAEGTWLQAVSDSSGSGVGYFGGFGANEFAYSIYRFQRVAGSVTSHRFKEIEFRAQEGLPPPTEEFLSVSFALGADMAAVANELHLAVTFGLGVDLAPVVESEIPPMVVHMVDDTEMAVDLTVEDLPIELEAHMVDRTQMYVRFFDDPVVTVQTIVVSLGT